MTKIIETLRQRISTSSLGIVSAPFLPSTLITTALMLAFTDWMVLLIGQSGAYWIDANRANSSLSVMQDLLSAGIIPFLLAGLAYLILLWLLLTILTRSLSLIFWLPVSLVHLAHILFWGIGKIGKVNVSQWDQSMIAGVNAGAALIVGILLVRMLIRSSPVVVTAHSLRNKIKPVLLLVWILLLLSAVLVSAIGKRGGWVRLQPDHSPGRRANAGIALDPIRNRIVMFGGISDWLGGKFLYENDTWEWDGNDWIEMHPDTIPQARQGHMMAYDEKNGVVVMFGGEDKSGQYVLSDTWEWDGVEWKQAFVDTYPQARRGGQLFYDSERETMILSGGFYYSFEDHVPTMIDDVWEWNGREWRYLGFMPTSLIVTNPNTVYDPNRDQTILFNYNQILAWDNGQWLNTGIETNLPPRLGARVNIDPRNGNMLLFSGINNGIRLEDTWMLDGNTWRELHPDPSPSARDAYMMFHDPTRDSFILYGGIIDYTLDDMWELVIP